MRNANDTNPMKQVVSKFSLMYVNSDELLSGDSKLNIFEHNSPNANTDKVLLIYTDSDKGVSTVVNMYDYKKPNHKDIIDFQKVVDQYRNR